VAVGLGQPASLTALVALLLSMVLGLGAMIASSVAGGALIDDMEVVEPEADGPRPVGAPQRLAPLLTWLAGAMTLVGVPFLAGFGPRQLTAQAGLQVGGLTIPLVGLCWAGDALIALALLRAVAPAFLASPATADKAPRFSLADAPGAVLAGLALLVGVVPGVVLQTWVSPAAESLAIPATFAMPVHARFLGYDATLAQWPASLAWIALAALTIMLLAALPASARVPADVWRGGQDDAAAAGESAAEVPADGEAVAASGADEAPAVAEPAAVEAERLGEPVGAWSDLAPAFTSPWTMPGKNWLLSGIDDGDGADDGGEGKEGKDDGEPALPEMESAAPRDEADAPAPSATEEVTSGNE
jgi:hypothetical protein